MFLVPEKNLAIAMVMNTYNPILGFRVSRVPGNILRMLLGQATIQLNEILFRQIIYVLVMLIPLLHFLAVVMTLRRVRSWRRGAPLSPQTQIVRYVALPLIWNAAIAYVLLVTLPKAFEVDISTMILIQPDASWVAVASGIFAIGVGSIENWHCSFNHAPNDAHVEGEFRQQSLTTALSFFCNSTLGRVKPIMASQPTSNQPSQRSDGNQSMIYQIRIKGHLSQQWTDWFEGLTITLEEDGDTLLTGTAVDQAELHGIFKKVRDPGIPLFSVNSVAPNQTGMVAYDE